MTTVRSTNTHSIKSAIRSLGVPYYRYSASHDKQGNERDPRAVCPLASFDPAAIRGFEPPAPRTSAANVQIPISINAPDNSYEWITPSFRQLVELNNQVWVDSRRFFAIFLENQPQHLMIDLDCKVEDWPGLVDQEVAIDAEMRRMVPVFYETQFGTVPDMTRWRADKVPAPVVGAREKTSMHFNLPSVAFRTTLDLHEFTLRFVRWLVENYPASILVGRAVDSDGKVNLRVATPIDVGVFTRNRNMRMSFSQKAQKGKLPLIPMDPNTTMEDALWSSLVSYSMSPDPNDWVSYKEHTECDTISPPSSDRAKAAKRRAVVAGLDADDQTAAKRTSVMVGTAETATGPAGAFDVDCDKGTIAEMPEKTLVGQASGRHDVASVLSRLPPPSLENLRKMVWSLDREKRLFGALNAWRDAVWAIKSIYPGDDGYALAAEWTKIWEDKSGRTSDLAKTWGSGRGDSFNVGSLWRWCKEDLEPAAYKALWKTVNPPAVMRAAKQALRALSDAADGLGPEQSSCVEALLKKSESLQAAFDQAFLNDEKMNTADELPFKAVMAWWDEHVISARKALMLDDEGVDAVGVRVLHYCNIFWRFVRLENTVVFYKKSRRAPDDDRTYSWQVTSSAAFQKDLNSNFVLTGWREAGKVPNVAVRWIKWPDRVSYNSHARVPPTARPQVLPAPTCFNTWVELKVSHSRARASAPEGAPNPEWDLFKDYVENGFLKMEKNTEVRKYFLRWYVSQYVRPGFKLKVACGLQSVRRQVGKSFNLQVLQYLLLGEDLVTETDSENCLEKFNDPIIGKVLVNIEEFERNRQNNKKLKVLITSNTMMCHPKGHTAYEGPNCLNFYMPSNHADAFDMTDFSRRIFVVQIGDGIFTEGYEHLLDRDWDAVQLARGMLDWWANPENGCVDADGKVIWKAEKCIPETTGALNQRLAGEKAHDPVNAWVRAAINNELDGLKWNEYNSNADLYRCFSKYCDDDKKVLGEWTAKKVTAALHTLCPAWTSKKQRVRRADTARQRCAERTAPRARACSARSSPSSRWRAPCSTSRSPRRNRLSTTTTRLRPAPPPTRTLMATTRRGARDDFLSPRPLVTQATTHQTTDHNALHHVSRRARRQRVRQQTGHTPGAHMPALPCSQKAQTRSA